MKDSYCQARLISPKKIRLVLFTSTNIEKVEASLIIDHFTIKKLTEFTLQGAGATSIVDFPLKEELPLGHSYCLSFQNFGIIPLDVSEATTFPGFDEKYHYEGELGARYSKEKTDFSLFAPLASSVKLKYKKKLWDNFTYLDMERDQFGTYHVSLKGDHDGLYYLYEVTNNEVSLSISDPYGKTSTANGKLSYSCDFNRLSESFAGESLPRLPYRSQCIIYEGHVRDLTIHPNSNIVHKGKFLGLVEHNRVSKGGNPVGLDYLANLGITHLQLLPIYDYKSVDELNPDSSYNWGYDPAQYFVPEGSYSSDPENPEARVKECLKMVNELAKKGIRVVMDVVYNHVYEAKESVYEKAVPNYYFRKRHNGKLSNSSGCGNDLDSERPMVRRLILDSAKWWINFYHVRGFRFDLMGIIDVDTLNLIKDYAFSIDHTFLLYGEGWDMGSKFEKSTGGTMANYRLLPDFSFFNDCFRENAKGYFANYQEHKQAFKSCICGNSLDFILPKRFLNAAQSINYVECHDNETYFDYLGFRHGDYSEKEKLERVLLASEGILLSYGIPFIHAGQEIGLSKGGNSNSYNAGDLVNRFDFDKLDERMWMLDRIKKAICFRKSHPFLWIYDPKVIDDLIDIGDYYDGIRIIYLSDFAVAPYKGIELIYNPSDNSIPLNGLKVGEAMLGECLEENKIPPRSVIVTANKQN